MTHRRRRAALRLAQSETYAGQPGAQWLLRERKSSSTPPPSSPQDDDNPFAPPPEGQPDQPWQPRKPANGDGNDDDGDQSDAPQPAKGRWSPRQPGHQSGGFGGGRQNSPAKQGGQGGGNGPGLRWDPKDPTQRRARYALLSGMWAFFFSLFDLPELALLLGVLAVYWGISSLRAKPDARQDPTSPTPATPAPGPSKQQTTAAVSGLVTAGLALAIVATTFTVQLVYRDYYTCVQDSLTQSAQVSCNDLLPETLRPVFGVKE
ncbi:hypothetical protein [Streptomyces hypolithicus]